VLVEFVCRRRQGAGWAAVPAPIERRNMGKDMDEAKKKGAVEGVVMALKQATAIMKAETRRLEKERKGK